jgi:hypothetical protein
MGMLRVDSDTVIFSQIPLITRENTVDLSFISNIEKHFSLANEEVTEKEMNDAINDDCPIILESIIVKSECFHA